MEKVIIAAMDENNTIGKDGDIPWHFPEDLKHFKKATTGYPVVMGSETYKSLPDDYRPLSNRKNIVLTRSGVDLDEDFIEAENLEDAWKLAEETGKDKVFIAGGSTVYRQTLDQAEKMMITRIHSEYDGDTYFPEWDHDKWIETRRDERSELSFITYERKNT